MKEGKADEIIQILMHVPYMQTNLDSLPHISRS